MFGKAVAIDDWSIPAKRLPPPIVVIVVIIIVGRVWRIGRVDTFRPKDHGFDYRSSRHVRTLGKYFTHSCLWRFGVKFRCSIRAVSGAPLSSSGLEEALEK